MKKNYPIFDSHLELFSWKQVKWKKLSNYLNKVTSDVQFREAGPNKIKQGNVKMGLFCINTALSYNWHLKNSLKQINSYKKLATFDNNFKIIYSKQDFEDTLKSDKIGIILYLENVKDIDKNLHSIDILYKAGIRVIQIMWDEKNDFGGSHIQPRKGLTQYGHNLVKRMEELNITVDLAHTNERTFFDILKIIKKPPIISHCGLKKIVNHSRNISDKQLKALAEKQGVAGIFLVPEYINNGNNKSFRPWIENIKYGLKVVGANYLGLGSDFGGMLGYVPEELQHIGEIQKLAKALQKERISDKIIRKILFDNFIRIFRENLPK